MSILISGILVNPAGVPVVGAEITFTALTTSESILNGFSASIITNDNGEYAIPLEYCVYSISIQSDGHNTVYGAVSITEKSTPATINELLKLAAMEQTVTPAIIVYFREIQADVAEKLAAVKALNDSAKDAANCAIAARNEAAQYAQSVNLAVVQAQQASVAAGNAASIAETAAENATETLSYYQQQLVGWQQILTGSGDVTLTAPDGQTVTVRSQQAWDAALNGKADLTQAFRKRGGLGTVDLNTITGEQDGMWTQNSNANATLAKNYPTPIAGSLLVVQGTANGNTAAHQLYFPYNTTRVYIRYFLAGGTWGTWSEIWNSASLVKQSSSTDTTAGAILTLSGDTGSFGLGGIAPRMPPNSNIADYLRTVPTGFYAVISSNETVGLPTPVTIGAGYVFHTIRYNPNPLTIVTAYLIGGGMWRGTLGSSGAITWFSNWDSSNLTKQSGIADTTAGAVIINGAHGGVGGNAIFIADTADLHTYLADKPSGVFSGNTPLINGAGYSAIYDFKRSSANYAILIATPLTQGAALVPQYKIFAAGAWNNWQSFITGDSAQTIIGQKTFSYNGSGLFIKPATDAQSGYIRGLTYNNLNHWYIGKGGADYAVAWANQYSTAANSITLRENGNIDVGVTSGKALFLIIGGTSGRVLSQGHNAVADSNGFWKTASPVVKLFADGTSELTSEAEGITTERLSEGVYRISGCLGLNADLAWGGIEGGISCPKCRNGLERVWNDYDVETDGSIVIRTYHRSHPDALVFARNEIEGYANGDPIDIPHDTFISVRVQMPEREEEKLKVMHSNVYCNTVTS